MKYYQKTTSNETAQLLKKSNDFAIFAHTRPDGDTIGASVALYIALTKLGKTAELFCDSDFTPALKEFGVDRLFNKKIDRKYNTYIAVDCAASNRLGEYEDLYLMQNNTITIDHHKNQMFSKYNCVKEYSSCTQLMHEIIVEMGVLMDEDIATYLFMGLSTDTGNFQHSNSTKEVFELANILMNYNVDNEKIARVFFKDTTLAKTKLIAKVLTRIRTYFDDRLVIVYSNKQELLELGLSETDTEGLVQYAINIDTALVGVAISEYKENVYKVSMRGKHNTDVRSVCEIFGGGGHMLASGCMISGYFEDVIDKIVKSVGDLLDA